MIKMGKILCNCDSPNWDSEYLETQSRLDGTEIEIWHCWCSNCGAKWGNLLTTKPVQEVFTV